MGHSCPVAIVIAKLDSEALVDRQTGVSESAGFDLLNVDTLETMLRGLGAL